MINSSKNDLSYRFYQLGVYHKLRDNSPVDTVAVKLFEYNMAEYVMCLVIIAVGLIVLPTSQSHTTTNAPIKGTVCITN